MGFNKLLDTRVFTKTTVKLRCGIFAFSENRCMFASKSETAITSVVLLSRPKLQTPLKTSNFGPGPVPTSKSSAEPHSETIKHKK